MSLKRQIVVCLVGLSVWAGTVVLCDWKVAVAIFAAVWLHNLEYHWMKYAECP